MTKRKKMKRNLSGLQNQPQKPCYLKESVGDTSQLAETVLSKHVTEEIDGKSENDNLRGWDPGVRLDSNRPC